MAELKPCPFCSGEAVVRFAHPDYMLKRLHNRYIFAGCVNCKITTPLFYANNKTRSPLINEFNTEQAKKQAIAAWNKRAETDSDGLEPVIRFFRD